MTKRNIVSTPTHLNSLGGEVLSYAKEGAIIGSIMGLAVGITMSILAYYGKIPLFGMGELSFSLLSVFFIAGWGVFFGIAGAVVGIGVPKHNPRPDQGPVKRWRSVVITQGEHREVFFVPEEKRQIRQPLVKPFKNSQPLPKIPPEQREHRL